jgi:hypothetical protein
MGKAKAETDVEQIVQRAQDEFDLEAELNDQSRITKTVRVYLDQVAGHALGGIEIREEVGEFGIPVLKTHAWGILEKIADLTSTDEDAKKNDREVKALKEEAKALQARLEASAMDLELTWVPSIVKDDAHRAARSALGIHEKVTTTHPRHDEYAKEYDAQTLQRIVLSVTKVATGAKNKGISIEGARSLRGKLPDWEWAKVNDEIAELLWEKHISSQAVENKDF